MYSTINDGRTPRHGSVPMSVGRRYRLVSGFPGTHAESTLSSASIDPRKSCACSSGSASLRADAASRAAFAPGLNRCTEPSAQRYAFNPSNTCWP